MKKHLFYSLLMLISLMGCNAAKANPEAEEVEEGLPVINLSENVKEVSTLNLSDAAKCIEIVKLETSEKSLIQRISSIEVTSNDIWVGNGVDNVFRFSHDGSFLNIVGKRGQGPDSYNQMASFFVDDIHKEVYITSFTMGIQVYDYEGNHLRKELKRGIQQLSTMLYFQLFRFGDTWMLSQNLSLNNYSDSPKDSLWSIAVYDKDFNRILQFKNPAHMGREDDIVSHSFGKKDMINYWWEIQNKYDTYNDELTLKLTDTDTIYVYDRQIRSFSPQYAIYSDEQIGDYGLTHEIYPEHRAFDYFTLVNYFNTKDIIYLFGSKGLELLTYAYDKQSHAVRLCKRKGEIYAHNSQSIIRLLGHDWFEYFRDFILTNDISGGSYYVRNKSQGKYWINYIQPGSSEYELFVDELRKTPDAPQKQQLLDIIAKTDEEDNPILLIAVLK